MGIGQYVRIIGPSTISWSYMSAPIPRLDDILEELYDSRIFSKI